MKALASLAAILAFAAAGSATAQEARIAWGDLDLSTPTGAAAFDARIESAARDLCKGARRPNSLISDRANCRAAVQAEALRQLPGRAQVDYARGRRSLVV